MVSAALVLIIVLTVDSFFTLDPAIHSYAKWIQRGAILFLFLIALLPLLIVPLAFALPESAGAEVFGKKGGMKTKAAILTAGACLCTTIAGFKVGTLWSPPRSADNPAWYDSKGAFYVFNFSLEIVLLVLYISARVDQRFHVPDGSSKRKTYATQDGTDSEDDSEKPESLREKRDSAVGDEAA